MSSCESSVAVDAFDQARRELFARFCSRTDIDNVVQKIQQEVVEDAYVNLLQRTADSYFSREWQHCRSRCKQLIDVTWEHLNTGNWKDVSIVWRYAYTIASLFLAASELHLMESTDKLRDVVRLCDMGLLMGAPVMNNVLARLADELIDLHVRLAARAAAAATAAAADAANLNDADTAVKRQKLEPTSGDDVDVEKICRGDEVDVISCPSIENFTKTYMSTGTPVVIRDCMGHWPAMSARRWSTAYLREVAGWRLVPVEIGSRYTDDSWSQTLMTIDDFIDRYIVDRKAVSGELQQQQQQQQVPVGYLAQHQLFDQIPRLRRDIVVPDYCAVSSDDSDADDVDVNAWFGPRGTVSPLHRDAKHNLLSQVVGRKYVKLYDPVFSPRLYPFTSQLLDTTSQVDVENPDYEQFPLFEGVTFKDCVLGEGDMLYIPPLYWHFVRSLSVSFSVSFWWS